MGFHFEFIVALFCLGVVGSCHASMPAELYWKSVFPNTPMPKSLQDLLRPVNKNNFVKLKDDAVIDAKIVDQLSNPSANIEGGFHNYELKSGTTGFDGTQPLGLTELNWVPSNPAPNLADLGSVEPSHWVPFEEEEERPEEEEEERRKRKKKKKKKRKEEYGI
ncbi:hypothetical protein SLEP1_g27205 [Rubroshorea leprosula]|uniref:Uncharacterized protein n=1 Tax=Rubroshorea leprosula TaxID=152421 RepID=A0AAV5JPP8_9ROSI|nr:hypothetical protein SLEP1_g27205 [Rubroshorea leprosula]